MAYWFLASKAEVSFPISKEDIFVLNSHDSAMTQPYISERTASVIKTQYAQMDWDRFHPKCILAELCRFRTRPTVSNGTSHIQKLNLYQGQKYSCLPIAIETQYAHP